MHRRRAHVRRAVLAIAASGLALSSCASPEAAAPPTAVLTSTTPATLTATGEKPVKEPAPAGADERDPIELAREFLQAAVDHDAASPTARWRRLATTDLASQPSPLAASIAPAGARAVASMASAPKLDCTADRCEMTSLVHTQLLNTAGQVITDNGYHRCQLTLVRQPDRTWLVATLALDVR